MLDDWKIIKEDYDLFKLVWEFICNNGFFGMVVDKKYGGKGFFVVAYLEMVMKIFICSVIVVVIVMVFNFFGFVEFL